MSDKAPAFQFYPKDWLSDARVRAMGREARGVYIDLLAIYWNEGGLPSDTKQLARIAGVPQRTFERLWTMIVPCFGITGPALTSKRLDREKTKQAEYRNAQALKGQKSAKSRVSNKDDQPRLQSGSFPVEPRLEPKPNFPFASSSSSAFNNTQQQQQQAPREAAAPYASSTVPTESQPKPWIDFDPKSPLQQAVVARVEDLTPDGTDDDRREMLRTLSLTPDEGVVLEGSIRQASAKWLAMTIATAARFERENTDDPDDRSP